MFLSKGKAPQGSYRYPRRSVFVSGYELPCGGALAVAGMAPGLDPETPTEADNAVAELLTLLVRHELVP
jgi:hypothetical protein